MNQSELDSLLEDLKTESNGAPVMPRVSATALRHDCLLIGIDGRAVGARDAAVVFGRIRDLARSADQHIILDLDKCPYLSSLVLGELSGIVAEKLKQNRTVFVVGANDMMRSLLDLTGLDQFISVRGSRQEALQALGTDTNEQA